MTQRRYMTPRSALNTARSFLQQAAESADEATSKHLHDIADVYDDIAFELQRDPYGIDDLAVAGGLLAQASDAQPSERARLVALARSWVEIARTARVIKRRPANTAPESGSRPAA